MAYTDDIYGIADPLANGAPDGSTGIDLKKTPAISGKASMDPSVYGWMAASRADEADRQFTQGINDMLRAQWADTDKRRTDYAKMAQMAALGNVLQTIFASAGWIGSGTTSQVTNPDQRSYITAFNEALRARNDLSNVGTRAAEMRLNMAGRRADREYNANLQRENMRYQAENQRKAIELRKEYDKQLLAMKTDANQNIQDRYDARADRRQKGAENLVYLRGNVRAGHLDQSAQNAVIRKIESDYSTLVRKYSEAVMAGEDVSAPPSKDEFMKQQLSSMGYVFSDGSGQTGPGRRHAGLGSTVKTDDGNGRKRSAGLK